MHAFQYPFRPDEDYSSSWKLVYNSTRCSVPEITSLLHDTKLVWLTWAHFPLSSVVNRSSLVFKSMSSVCNRPSSVFRCTLLLEASHGQEWYYVGFSWPELKCIPYPPVEAHHGQEWYSVGSSWTELRYTPCRGILWPRVVLSWVQLNWAQIYTL